MKSNQVAIQLYTLRDHCKTAADLAVTARKVREIGYTAVQVSGVGPIPEEEIANILRNEGLVLCATHEGSQIILDEPQRIIDRLGKLGCNLTAYPYPGGVDFQNPEHIETLVTKLDAAGAVLRAAGITLGYHNHGIEFVKQDGRTILDIIYSRTRPENLVAELDTYWVQYGGGDVVDWCQKLAGRLPFIHLKDYGFTHEHKPTYCEIGAGNLRFDKIVAEAEKSGCKWFIVEQDKTPGDPFDSIKQSFEYIKANLVS